MNILQLAARSGRRAKTALAKGRPHLLRITAPAGIFILALTLRLVYLAEIRDSPYFGTLVLDAYEYDQMAGRLLRGDWLIHYDEGYVHGLLYPFVLAPFKAAAGSLYLFAIRLFQAVLGALSCVLVFRLAGRFFPRPVPLIAGLLAAGYWPFVFFGGELLVTTLVLFLELWLAVVLSWRSPAPSAGTAVGAGILMGLLVMGRSNTVLLLPVVLGWLHLASRAPAGPGTGTAKPFGHRSALTVPLAFLLAFAVSLCPFLVRNWLVQGTPLPFQGSWSFYMGNNPQADGTPYARQGLIWQRLERLPIRQGITEPAAKGAFYLREALHFIREQPAAYLSLLYRKLRLFWHAGEIPVSADLRFYERHAWLARVLVLDFGFAVPFALVGMAWCWNRRRELFLLHGFVLAYLASGLLFSVCDRYRLPALPFLLIFSACGIRQLWELLRSCDRCRAGGFLLALGAAFALVHTGVDTRQVDHLRSASLLGQVYLRQQRFDLAEQIYLGGLRENPDDADMYNGLGVVYEFQRRDQEAENAYAKAVEIAPDHTRARINLGKLYLKEQRLQEAETALKEALRHDPGPTSQHDAHAELGQLYLAQGDPQQAHRSCQRALQAQERPLTYYALANACAQLGLGEEQLRALERAVQLDPTLAPAHRNLGALYLQRGDYPAAEIALLKAVRHDPNSAVAYRHLGTLYARQGKPEQARAAFARAQQLGGNR
jgi:tetratricopeptide (TPR) repeat protein